jgi:hypothetical protein
MHRILIFCYNDEVKKLLYFIVLTLSFLIFPHTAFAESEFSTAYDVTYDVSEDSTTTITQKISLTNLTSQYYASKYTLSIGSTTLENVQATDSEGILATTIEKANNRTNIDIKFNKQVAGQGKVQTFTIKYTSKDFAQKLGKTWEVNLPKIPTTSVTKYNLVLSVPTSFGDPTSIAPFPRSQSSTFDKLYMTFDKDQLEQSGVSANFGSNQVFDFTLKYHLDNKALFPVMTNITLPPDTQYQDVLISRISPPPLNVTVDEDGNYLAWYQLTRNSTLDVAVNGSTKLYINSKIGKVPQLSQVMYQQLTSADRYWEANNPSVKAKLAEIFKGGTPNTNTEKVRLIYRYVVDSLTYDTSRLNENIERMGAVTALNNAQKAVCMEFTDLFIALVRAAGIPARELDGFAYSQNQSLRPSSLQKDLLHAWPEYYDPEKGWVMVDPTWENTSGGVDYFHKFDLNHFVLVTKGLSSQNPYTSDDITVHLSESEVLGKPQVDVSIEQPQYIWSGFPAKLTVKISNVGNYMLRPTDVVMQGQNVTIQDPQKITFGTIPAYGSTTHQFKVRPGSLTSTIDEMVTVYVGDQKFEKRVRVEPFILFRHFPYIFIGMIAVIAGLYGLLLGFHIYKRNFKKKYHKKT